MSRLTERILSFDHYQKEFATWEATEQIIDDNKAFWMLRKSGSQYQKVCLYRDGCNMFIYGDYGQFTFDSMTWKGDVYNLEYDNIGYQMEKLNYESKQSLYVYDSDRCKDDLKDWLKETTEYSYENNEEMADKIFELLCGTYGYSNSYIIRSDIDEFCTKNNCNDLHDIIEFINEALDNMDEYEWVGFLRKSNLGNFDEICESSLWNAGKRINQRYFICMYALQVCGEKLKERKGELIEKI